jgi:hypothetical protein
MASIFATHRSAWIQADSVFEGVISGTQVMLGLGVTMTLGSGFYSPSPSGRGRGEGQEETGRSACGSDAARR